MGSDEDDRIEALRATLARLTDAARTRTLLELGQALATRYWRTGPGRAEALPDLTAAIETLNDAYSYLSPGDLLRGQVAGQLGMFLGARHLAHAGPAEDRETGIHVLEEALGFANLPPVLVAMARLVLSQLYVSRVLPRLQSTDFVLTAMRGGAGPTVTADVDHAIRHLHQLRSAGPNSAEVIRSAEAMLTVAEAVRSMVGGLGSGPGGFDLSRMMEALSAMQRLQAQAQATAPGAGGPLLASMPFLFDADKLAALDPLDRPVAVVHATPPSSPTPPPPPRPAPVVTDLHAVRGSLRTTLTGLTGYGDVTAAAAALLRRPDPETSVEAIDETIELATMLVHDSEFDDPVRAGTDRFALAAALHARGRLASGWGDDVPGDHLAAAENLAEAARMLPPTHPAAVAVLAGLGAFLDEARPLGGALDLAAGRLGDMADAVIREGTAVGTDLAVVRAVGLVCRVSAEVRAGRFDGAGELEDAVDQLPPDHPWLSRFHAAARLANLCRTMLADPAATTPQPTLADLAHAMERIGADGLVHVGLADERIDAVRLNREPARLDLLPYASTMDDFVGAVAAGLDKRPGRVLVASGRPDLSPLTSARTATGRYATEELVVSHVTSAAQVIALARKAPRPVAEDAVFLANPRGDRAAATIEVMLLRRIYYPRSTGLGQTGEDVAGAGTPTDLLAHLGASMMHLACGVGDGATPAFELAGPARLDAATIAAHARPGGGGPEGGLAVLPPDVGAYRDTGAVLADALLTAGFSGVVDWLWPVAPPVAALMLVVLHANLIDNGLPPAMAVRAVHRWMLDSDRQPPPHLPPCSADAMLATDLTDPRVWAALVHRGR